MVFSTTTFVSSGIAVPITHPAITKIEINVNAAKATIVTDNRKYNFLCGKFTLFST